MTDQTKIPKLDIVDCIIRYESGEMEAVEIVEFFAELIKSGQAWSLQGSYGRMAQQLINASFISSTGEIDYDLLNDQLEN